jgi:hypothetical protein
LGAVILWTEVIESLRLQSKNPPERRQNMGALRTWVKALRIGINGSAKLAAIDIGE